MRRGSNVLARVGELLSRTTIEMICWRCGAREFRPRSAMPWSTLWCSACGRPMVCVSSQTPEWRDDA